MSRLPEPAATTRAPHTDHRIGVLAAIAAYTIWGAFPLYWPLLEPAGALEILAHRIVWSLAVCVPLVFLTRSSAKVLAALRDRRTLALLLTAAVVITFNWGGYIWAVNNGHVVEASLGYFINPLVSVAFGVVLLGERLRRAQWVAVGIAVTAVVVLTFGYGRPPWIAFLLACSFATYGLLKKLAGVQSVPSLTIETAFLAPAALAYLLFLEVSGAGTFGHISPGHTILLATCGIVTALPLLAFNAAATRIPLSTVGLLQYIGPVLQFIIGLVIFGEEMVPLRWIGFTLVWAALAVFTGSALRHRMVAEGEPVVRSNG